MAYLTGWSSHFGPTKLYIIQTFIESHTFNSDQLRFLRAMQGVFLKKRKLQAIDLYESPFTNFGTDAVERWFSEAQIDELIY